MSYQRWLINKEISSKYQRARDQVFRRADRVISHDLTKEKQLADFPAVDQYLSERFPDVDLTLIKLYLTPPKVIERAGWKDIGGCYIRGKKAIIVKNEISHHYKAKGKFQRMMRDSCSVKTDVEDVIVHEFIHAVSDLIGRSLSRFKHMEEEFVYTNCIDFYHQKGMTNDDVVNNNFLPFCLQDVYESAKEMKSVFEQVNCTIDDIRQMGKEEYKTFLNKNADELVLIIKTKAQKMAHAMIELYYKYGAQMYKMASTEAIEDKTAMRFSSLDLE